MEPAIVVKNVTKTFGSKVAVRDLDLVLPKGSMCGFIGPNGAGKTTTIRMIMSILFPDSGEISVLGCPSALDAKDRIGYLPEERGVYRKMRVGSFLAYIARLKGLSWAEARPRAREWLARVGLDEVETKRCEELSKGMQQKVQFIAAVLHKPDLLILDEPFSGLDPINMRLLRELILEQRRNGATVIFSTHVMVQAEEICDHVVMINDGDKVLDDSLASIRARFDPRVVRFEPLDPEATPDRIAALGEVESVARTRTHWDVLLRKGADPARVMSDVVSAVTPRRVELHRPTLEDVFIEIVTGGDGSSRAEDIERLRAAVRPVTGAAAGAEG